MNNYIGSLYNPRIDVFMRQSKMGIDEAFLSFCEAIFCSEGKCGIAELNRGKERVMVKEEKVLLLFVF